MHITLTAQTNAHTGSSLWFAKTTSYSMYNTEIFSWEVHCKSLTQWNCHCSYVSRLWCGKAACQHACLVHINPPTHLHTLLHVYHFYQISFYLTHLISVAANKCIHNHTLCLYHTQPHFVFVSHTTTLCVCITHNHTLCLYHTQPHFVFVSHTTTLCVCITHNHTLCLYHTQPHFVFVSHTTTLCVCITHNHTLCLYHTQPHFVFVSHTITLCVCITHNHTLCLYHTQPYFVFVSWFSHTPISALKYFHQKKQLKCVRHKSQKHHSFITVTCIQNYITPLQM